MPVAASDNSEMNQGLKVVQYLNLTWIPAFADMTHLTRITNTDYTKKAIHQMMSRLIIKTKNRQSTHVS